METKNYFFYSLILLTSLLWSCGNKQTVDTPTTKDQISDSIQISNKIKNSENISFKTNTIATFWSVFQKAVADRDTSTLRFLYSPDAELDPYGFENAEEQTKIAAGSASDITVDPTDSDFYLFRMVFSAEKNRKATGDDSLEDSETWIYLKKEVTGDFKIFRISFGG